MDYAMRAMRPSEFKSIFSRMKKDFAFGEYAPYRILLRQLKKGVQQGFIFLADGQAAAYAICAQDPGSGIVLVSYFAVFEKMRGRGVGTTFLEAIKEYYGGQKAIIVEVEKPENARGEEEKMLRAKRMALYEKAGFEKLSGIEYSIWKIPLHLMVYPLGSADAGEAGRALYAIYLRLMGRRFIHMLEISYME